jgi:septum site-determining protein MinC
MFEREANGRRAAEAGGSAGRDGEGTSEDGGEDAGADLFATETMAELSARQGRFGDAAAIYRQLLRVAAAEGTGAPADAAREERIARWQGRLADLQARAGGGAPRSSPPPQTPPAVPPAVVTAAPRPSLVIREPVRSGQVVYAEGRDLIVMAAVNPGAQLMADGNIHVYASLKGRAIAGARGARDAQLFCLALEAELVGVDTGYVTSEDIEPSFWGGAARVYLNAEGRCVLAALSVGKPVVPGAVNRARRRF